MKPLIESALDYAGRGSFVFPARFVGKQKLGHTSAERSNGNQWGLTNDPETVRAYWQQWPSAAIGLPTGAINGLFVIDVDTFNGHEYDGRESLIKLEMQHGALPWTRMAETPTGSIHYYFKQPLGVTISCSASKLGPGIDVRGDGGFIVAPPSERPGRGAYTWINNAVITDAPTWLLGLVRTGRQMPVIRNSELRAMMEADSGKGVSLLPEDNTTIFAGMSRQDLELKIRVALSVVPSDDYDLWFRIGGAIFNGLGDAGYAVFDEWSRESTKYDAKACERKWRDCAKLRSIRVQTIFWHADQHDRGWRFMFGRLLNGHVAA